MKRTLTTPLIGTVVTAAAAGLGAALIPRYVVPALSPRPEQLGVSGGKLAPCHISNCVSSQAESGPYAMQPIPYVVDLEIARARLISILRGMPDVTIIDISRSNYIYAEARSTGLKFIDDVEFYFDNEKKLIHFRSAARLRDGRTHANRLRMEQIIREF